MHGTGRGRKRATWTALLTLAVVVLLTVSVPIPVSGAPPAARTANRAAAPTEYNVTFTETGLPSGTQWNVTFNGTEQSSTSASMVFVAPNGTYPYSVENPVMGPLTTIPVINLTISLEEYTAPQQPPTIEIGGSPVGVEIPYTTNYLLYPTVSPLTPGEGLVESPTLGYFPAGSVVAFLAGPFQGYRFTSWTGLCLNNFFCGQVAFSTSDPVNVTVGGPIAEIASFAQLTYAVNFRESGLPANSIWNVTLNGTSQTSFLNTITFNEPNGTYPFSVLSPLPNGPGSRYVGSPLLGSVTVKGAAVTVPVAFGEQFTLTVKASAAGAGNVTPADGWYDVNSTVNLTATAALGYRFMGWNGTGAGSYTGPENPVPLQIEGAVVETAEFAPVYAVTFHETGLPAGANWTVEVMGTAMISGGPDLSFTLLNGTYPYSVRTIPGYAPVRSAGGFDVAGVPVDINVAFIQVTYVVTVNEAGLPSGTSWTFTVDGVYFHASDGSRSFSEPNGTYTLWFRSIEGYSPSRTTVSMQVEGGGVVVNVTYSAPYEGPLGIGETLSYVVLSITVVAAVLVAALWWYALSGASKPRKPVKKPGRGSPSQKEKPPEEEPAEAGEETEAWADPGPGAGSTPAEPGP